MEILSGQPKNQNFDRLQINDFIAPDNGYILVYLSNESDYLSEVYFDDLSVTVQESPVIQSDDYYPFGLTFNSYQRVTSKQNDYLYNGKELQDELELNWLDYGARMHIPEIGRWGVVDPLADSLRAFSPYNYSQSNPVRIIDPNGKAPFDVIVKGTSPDKTVQAVNSAVSGIDVVKDKHGKLSYSTNGQKLNKEATELMKAIDDHSVEVNINSTWKTTNSSGGALIGGAYLGTKVNSDGIASSTNEYSSSTGNSIDRAFGKPGGTVIHEITEGYAAAKLSQAVSLASLSVGGIQSLKTGPANTQGSLYNAAHNQAIRQPGKIIETRYDASGMVLPLSTPINKVHHAIYKARGHVIFTAY